MKILFNFLISFFVSILIFGLTAKNLYAQESGVSVFFEPATPSSTHAGDSFTTHLYLQTPTDTFGFNLLLAFDTSQILINSIQPAALFNRSSGQSIDNSIGTLRYSRVNLDNVPPGKIDLGTVQMTFKKAGSGKISFSQATVTDSTGKDVQASTTPFSYTIISKGGPPGSLGGSGGNLGVGNVQVSPTAIPTPTIAGNMPCIDTDLGCIPTDPVGFVAKFYSLGLGIIGGVALIFIIYGGYLVMNSQGNPAQLSNGKSYIFYALLGLLLAIFGYAFVQIIVVNVLHVPGFS